MSTELDRIKQQNIDAQKWNEDVQSEADRNLRLKDLANYRIKRDKEIRDNLFSDKKDDLIYDENGELANDSDLTKSLKETYNDVVKSVFDAGTDYQFDVLDKGKKVNTGNKDFSLTGSSFSDMSTEELLNWIKEAPEEKDAKNVGYILRRYDGKNADNTDKYDYKIGYDKYSAANRYNNQNQKELAENGYEIVYEKRTGGVEQWENAVHTALSGLGVIDKGKDKSSGLNFGSGSTEVYDKDVLGNKFTDEFDNQSTDETARNEKASEAETAKYAKSHVGYDTLLRSAESGAVSLSNDILDAGLTGIGSLLNSVGVNNSLEDNIFDKWSKNADKFVGYDRQTELEATRESISAWKRGDYIDAVFNDMGGKANAVAGSIPEMFLLGSAGPAGGFKAVSLLKRLSSAEKEVIALKASAEKLMPLMSESNIVNNAAKIKKAEEVAASTRRALSRIGVDMQNLDKLSKQSKFATLVNQVSLGKGFNAVWAKNTNNIIEQRINNGDGDITYDEFMAISASTYISTALDRMTLHAITGSGPFKESVKVASDVAKNSSFGLKALKASSKLVAGSVAAMPVEAGQEYLQQWNDILGSQVGVNGKSIEDVVGDKKNQDAVLGAAIMGATGGLIMHGSMHTFKKSVNGILNSNRQASEDKHLDIHGNEAKITKSQSNAIGGQAYQSAFKMSEENDTDETTQKFKDIIDMGHSKSMRGYVQKKIVRGLLKNGSKSAANQLTELLKSGHIDAKTLKRQSKLATSDAMQDIREIYEDNKTMGSGFTDSDGNVIDTLLDETPDIGTLSNPVKGQLGGTINRLKRQKNQLQGLGLETDEIDKAIEIVEAYNTSDVFEKTMETVSAEAQEVGFVSKDGITKPSLRDYEAYLEDHIIEDTRGFADLRSLKKWSESRQKKEQSINNYGSVEFTTLVSSENERMGKVANDIIDSNREELTDSQLNDLQQIVTNTDVATIDIVNKSMENRPTTDAFKENTMDFTQEALAIKAIREAENRKDAELVARGLIGKFSSSNAAYEFQRIYAHIINTGSNFKKTTKEKIDPASLINDADNGVLKNEDYELYRNSLEPDTDTIQYLAQSLSTETLKPVDNMDETIKFINEAKDLTEASGIYTIAMKTYAMNFELYKKVLNALRKKASEELGEQNPFDTEDDDTENENENDDTENSNDDITEPEDDNDNDSTNSNDGNSNDEDDNNNDSDNSNDKKPVEEPVETKDKSEQKEEEYDTQSINQEIIWFEKLKEKINSAGKETIKLSNADKVLLSNIKKTISKEISKIDRHVKAYSKLDQNMKIKVTSRMKKLFDKFRDIMYKISTVIKRLIGQKKNLKTIDKALDGYLSKGEIRDGSKEKVSKIIDKEISSLQEKNKDKHKKLKKENIKDLKEKVIEDVTKDKPDTSSLRSSLENKMIELYTRIMDKIANNKLQISKKTSNLKKQLLFAENTSKYEQRIRKKLRKALRDLEYYDGKMFGDEFMSEKYMEKMIANQHKVLEIINKLKEAISDKKLKSNLMFLLKLRKDNSELAKELRELHDTYKDRQKNLLIDGKKILKQIPLIVSALTLDEYAIAESIGSKIEILKDEKSTGEDIVDSIENEDFAELIVESKKPLSYLKDLFSSSIDILKKLSKKFNLSNDTDIALFKFGQYINTIPNLKVLSTESTIVTDLMDVISSVDNGDTNFIGLFGTNNKHVAETIKFGSTLMIFAYSKVRLNLMNMDDVDLSKSAGISVDEANIMREYIYKGQIPVVVLRKDVMPIVMDRLGIRMDKDAALGTREQLEASVEAAIYSAFTKTFDGHGVTIVSKSFDKSNKSFHFVKVNKEVLGLPEDSNSIYSKISYMSNSSSRKRASIFPYKLKTVEKIINSTVELSNKLRKTVEKFNSTRWYFSDDIKQFMHEYENDKYGALSAFGYVDLDTIPRVEDKMLQHAHNEKYEREAEILFDAYNNSLDENGEPRGVYVPWGFTKSMRLNSRSDLNVQESKIHREFLHTNDHKQYVDFGKDSFRNIENIPYGKMTPIEFFENALSQAFDMDPDKNSHQTVLNDIRKVISLYGNKVEILVKDDDEKFGSLKRYLKTGSMKDLGKVFYDTDGGMHSVRAALELRKMNIYKSQGKTAMNTVLTIEADAITSGSILLLLKILNKRSLELLEKGGIYTNESKDKWEKYTKTLLYKKFKEDGRPVNKKDITFTAGALIEAGKYHLSTDPDTKIEGQAPFLDIYMTVGDIAMSLYHDFKRDTYPKLGKFKKQMFYAVFPDGFTLAQMRSLAKDPTMITNYGALISSVKRALSRNTYDKTIINRISSDRNFGILKEYFTDMIWADKKHEDLSPREKNILVNKAYNEYILDENNFIIHDKENNMFINPSKEYLEKMSIEDKVNSIIVNEEMSDKLYGMSRKTVGYFFEYALDGVFGDIKTMRESGKIIDLIVSKIFSMRFEKRLQEIKDSQDSITQEDFINTLKEFEKNGVSHTVDHHGEIQPLYKTENLGDKSKKSFANIKVNGKDSTKITINRKGLTFTNNAGAAVTIPIHALDSSIIIEALKNNEFTNIYDAIVAGLKLNKMQEASNVYNTEVITQSLSRNDLKVAHEKLDKMLSTSTEEEIAEIAKMLSPLVHEKSLLNDTILTKNVNTKINILSLGTVPRRVGDEKKSNLWVHRINYSKHWDKEENKVIVSRAVQSSSDGSVINVTYRRKNSEINDIFKTVRIEPNKDGGASLEIKMLSYTSNKAEKASAVTMSIEANDFVDPSEGDRFDGYLEHFTKLAIDKSIADTISAGVLSGLLVDNNKLERVDSSINLKSNTNKSTEEKEYKLVKNDILSMIKITPYGFYETIDKGVVLINDGVSEFNKNVNELYSNHLFVNGVEMSHIKLDENSKPKKIKKMSNESLNIIDKIRILIAIDAREYLLNIIRTDDRINDKDNSIKFVSDNFDINNGYIDIIKLADIINYDNANFELDDTIKSLNKVYEILESKNYGSKITNDKDFQIKDIIDSYKKDKTKGC